VKPTTPESIIKSTNTLTDTKAVSAYSLDNRQLLFTKSGSSSDDVKLYNYDGTGVTLTFPASYSGMFLLPFAVQPNAFIGTSPTLNLDFTTGVLNSNFTFTRGLSGTYINSTGYVTTATTNIPRFDYDPTTLAARGLLMEPSASNYIKTSEDIGGVAQWGATNITQGTPLVSSPSGTVTGVLLQETAVSGAHCAYQTVTVVSGNIYTFSVWVKPYGSRTTAALRLATSGAAVYYSVAFNLTGNGSIGTTDSSTPTTPTNTAQSITYYAATGWYRISITMASTASTALIPYVCVSDSASPTWSSGLPVYTGSTSQGIYAWGAQLEDRATPSSYIPTGSAVITRNKDVASMPVNTFTYLNTGTFVYYGSRLTTYKTGGYHDIFTVDGAGNLGYAARLGVENSTGRLFANTTNTAASAICEVFNKGNPGAGPTMADNSKIKVAFTYDVQIPQGNLISSNDGNTYMYLTASVTNSTNLPAGLTLNLLRDALNPTWFEKLQYWPVRMESSQLQALTTTIP
jgi:hypothetical protein